MDVNTLLKLVMGTASTSLLQALMTGGAGKAIDAGTVLGLLGKIIL